MSYYKYNAFLKVVELGSLTRAADVLGYTQPGLTNILNTLETELGVKLLTRDRSGVYLNAAGEEALPFIKKIYESEIELRQRLTDIHCIASGVIRVGVMTSIATHILPEILSIFNETHPDVTVKLIPGWYDEIEEWLSRGQVDIGFTIEPTKKTLDTYPVCNDKIVALVPRGSELEQLERIPQKVLLDHPYILQASPLLKDYDNVGIFDALKKNAKYIVNDDGAIFAMVEKGFGIALMPKLLLKRISYDIVQKELSPPAHRTISVALKPENASPLAEQFLNVILRTKDQPGLWTW